MPHIIYYYQTFNSLKPILITNTVVTHIHLSSIHFGKDNYMQPYIHLNDYKPNNEKFNTMWKEIEIASKLGIKIILMIGGAGRAFTNLFSDFDVYYNLLKKTIIEHPYISGIDLDIEESVDINYVKKLINKIKNDFGKNFIITMAPVAYALQNDIPGMGGFIYKDLFNSNEGKLIDYFNVQFYYDFSFESYKKVIDNGYPENKIIMGVTSEMDFNNIKDVTYQIYKKYGEKFGGMFNWEYGTIAENPYKWASDIHDIFKDDYYCILM